MSEQIIASYVSPNATGFSFRINKTRLRFKNGALDLTDPMLVKELDDLIITNPTFQRLVKKVDKAAALKLMNAHKDSVHGGIKGGITAQGVIDAQKTPLASDAALSNLDVEQQNKLIDDIQEDNGLNITKVPEAPVQQPLKESKPAKPATLLNLGKAAKPAE